MCVCVCVCVCVFIRNGILKNLNVELSRMLAGWLVSFKACLSLLGYFMSKSIENLCSPII